MATVAILNKRRPSIVDLAFAGLRKEQAREAKASRKSEKDAPPEPTAKKAAPVRKQPATKKVASRKRARR